MNKFVLLSCLLAGFMLQSAAAENYKVAVVNVADILEQAPQVERIKNQLEKEFAQRDRELVDLQKELRKLEDRLVRDGAIMSDSERDELDNDRRAKKRELKRLQDEFREDLNIRRNQELGTLQREVMEAIKGLAKSENYDLIMSEGVVFASDRINITTKVLERLNAAFKKGN